MDSIAKVVGSSPETRRPRVLFRDSHGVAIELVGEIGTEGGTFGKRQQPRAKVVNDSGRVLFFFDLENGVKAARKTV